MESTGNNLNVLLSSEGENLVKTEIASVIKEVCERLESRAERMKTTADMWKRTAVRLGESPEGATVPTSKVKEIFEVQSESAENDAEMLIVTAEFVKTLVALVEEA